MNRSLKKSFVTQISPLPLPTSKFTGKAVIVTGANSGVGLEVARHFVRLDARNVIIGCRDVLKANAAVESILSSENALRDKLEVWEVDLGSFASIKRFCRRADQLERLDIVVHNAGLLSQFYHQFEGYERQCTVNVISTWLMALSLLPIMTRTKTLFYDEEGKTGIPHMCVVGSNAHFYTKFGQRNEARIFEALRGNVDMYNRYADTKLVSLLVMREMARRLQGDGGPQVILNMVDPGFCKTDLLREQTGWVRLVMGIASTLLARTPEMGSRTIVWAASAGPQSHGIYVEDCALSTPAPFADTEEGKGLQTKVFRELVEIWEDIDANVTRVIRPT